MFLFLYNKNIRIIWSSRRDTGIVCFGMSDGNTSIVTLYNTRNTSIVMLQYW